ncbi:MAG TPA: hypothetical protein VFN02_04220 [Ktedonobacteraceae bacterium]|nr:hypothetical protein [Ktedonobacteraceae bacterium]
MTKEQARALLETHTPLSWLWQEIEHRFGKDTARDLYEGYLAELRKYQAEYRARKAAKRERGQLQ